MLNRNVYPAVPCIEDSEGSNPIVQPNFDP